jgi:hypothetical protein
MIRKQYKYRGIRNALAISALITGSASVAPVQAETASATKTTVPTSSSTDVAPILSQLSLLAKALANSDPTTTAGLWSSTGQYVDRDGQKFVGREMLQKRFAVLFGEEGKRFVELVPETTKLLSSDIAMTEGKVLVGEKKIPETRYVILLVKRDGSWLIESATEVPLAETDNVATTKGLSDLAWLVGSWEAENNGVRVTMQSHWDAEKRLIECRYEITRPHAAPEVDLQVIGFDSNTSRPVSWHFSSSGSYGFGSWHQKSDKWLVDANGIESDGRVSNATTVIGDIGPAGFSWQSIDRHVGGLHIPDTNPLNVKRVQPTADAGK